MGTRPRRTSTWPRAGRKENLALYIYISLYDIYIFKKQRRSAPALLPRCNLAAISLPSRRKLAAISPRSGLAAARP